MGSGASYPESILQGAIASFPSNCRPFNTCGLFSSSQSPSIPCSVLQILSLLKLDDLFFPSRVLAALATSSSESLETSFDRAASLPRPSAFGLFWFLSCFSFSTQHSGRRRRALFAVDQVHRSSRGRLIFTIAHPIISHSGH